MRVLVIGDVLLDRDVDGAVTRVAPDAPVPVVDVRRVSERAGGAGLAARLLARDGIEVVLAVVTADDAAGRRVRAGLHDRVRWLPLGAVPATRTITRVRSAGQSLLRVDEPIPPVPPGLDLDGAALRQELAGADAVLVADYGAGLTAHAGLRAALERRPGRIPLVWDPHPRGCAPVPGCTVVTPNLDEAARFAGSGSAADQLAVELRDRWRAQAVAVTAGHRGAFCALSGSPPLYVPAPQPCPGDPVGAGDRFAGTLAAALGAGAVISEAVTAAVQDVAAWLWSGGVAGAAFGTAPAGATGDVPDDELTGVAGDVPPGAPGDVPAGGAPDGLARAVRLAGRVRAGGGTVVATGGCFDLLHAGHVDCLQAARRLGDCLVVLLNSDRSVRRIKGPDRPVNREQDRRRVLEALDCVDAVALFDDDTPAGALTHLRPDIWAKGGDYACATLPEAALVPRWGGRVVVLPYLDGRSTTTILDRVKESRR